MMSPEVAWSLLIISAVSCVAFLVMAVGAARQLTDSLDEPRRMRNAEHGLVILCVLALLAGANVVTGVGFVLDDTNFVQAGAIIVRGGLITAVAYLALRRPDRE